MSDFDPQSNSSLNIELARILADVERLDETGQPTISQSLQDSIRRNIDDLEKLTRCVSQAAMFSENEDVSEIPAESLRFLLLPAVLGFLNGKLVGEERLEVLQREQIYYQDFLRRLQSYGIIDRKDDDKDHGDGASSKTLSDLTAQAQTRQMKIERYKEKQNLQAKLEQLRQRLNRSGGALDEDTMRQLYLAELNLWAAKVADTMDMARQELEMLQMREKMKNDPTSSAQSKSKEAQARPLKPFILTRTELQKTVFGMGYPSLPAMSLEDFFEQKRREGQIRVVSGQEEQRSGPITEEEEQIMREEMEEREQPEVVQHDRDYDEYKDNHRRGWGNTKNKG